MGDLTAFIAARLGEDETAAYGLCGNGLYLARWAVSGDSIFVGTEPPPGQPIAHAWDERVRQHIARHDPARALREVAAKRAMVARYEDCLARMEDPEYSAMAANIERLEYEEWILPSLAATWSDHGDYRAEWAPGRGQSA